MKYQIVILSDDAVFARMLELEFQMLDLSVFVADTPDAEIEADVILLDLDSVLPPPPDRYTRMIGFTRNFAISALDSNRQCSMILHRPFELRLLRQEVLAWLPGTAGGAEAQPKRERARLSLSLDRETCALLCCENRILLTQTEFCVMECLLANRGEVVSRETISAAIGESAANKTDVYVCFLRRKLEKVTDQAIILTVRGKGYRLK